MSDFKNIQFSQSSIDTYDTCRLKFKKIYIDNIKWSKDDQNFGSEFHLLAQRYYIGIDEQLEQGRPDYMLLNNLKKFLKREKNMYPEYNIKYKDEEMSLIAKVDLIKIEKEKIIIYDWKTNKSKFNRSKMEKSYQTKIYLHNVAEKFNISPNDISLIYYNPRFDNYVKIDYSDNDHKYNKMELKDKIVGIKNERDFKQKIGKHCSFCQFNSICNKQFISIDCL
ncbi:PD-(D/E)XK nuclease family protein [Tepidibacter hydrothermalis]|uniref:PD-(D/E)XK nuclease family protein n=1 Tax=Tepidibacter hydrothermalis TaxID=3036126 RepID=A0ABY8ECI0_9FIRM|nr:PD-(D/E)XK nuclease family protein [Tepidibacter hydrothermalis]WFD09207.1 PD-(D/E)XK nuclease family protein [Tepidibacter hydrothermalis]